MKVTVNPTLSPTIGIISPSFTPSLIKSSIEPTGVPTNFITKRPTLLPSELPTEIHQPISKAPIKTVQPSLSNIRIYNKVGLASGFVSDISYFTDKSNNIEFFVSAAMFARKEGIINGGNNQYVDFGFPVLRKIGTLLYQYEIALKCLE